MKKRKINAKTTILASAMLTASVLPVAMYAAPTEDITQGNAMSFENNTLTLTVGVNTVGKAPGDFADDTMDFSISGLTDVANLTFEGNDYPVTDGNVTIKLPFKKDGNFFGATYAVAGTTTAGDPVDGNVTVALDDIELNLPEGLSASRNGSPIVSTHVGDKIKITGNVGEVTGATEDPNAPGMYTIDSNTISFSLASVNVESVTLSDTTVELNVDGTKQLTATINPASVTGKTVAWESSAPTVATVDNTGKITAVSVGTATITATVDGKSATCTVTVKAATPTQVESVTLSDTAVELNVDGTKQLTATINPASVTGKTVTWESSAPTVATIDNTGKITAVGVGTATITATVDGKSATCAVTVKAATPTQVESVTLSDTAVELNVDGTKQLTATINPASVTGKTVTWESSAPTVATIDNTGKITAVGVGTATITATVDGKSATCAVTVKNTVSTERTIKFGAGISVKKGSTIINSGDKVSDNDVLTVSIAPSRGNKVTGFTVNGIHFDVGSTVKVNGEDLNISSETTALESYTITIPQNVSATLISDLGNSVLKNGDKIYQGEEIKIVAANLTGQTLKNLTVNGSKITSGDKITVNGTAITIEVEYEAAASGKLTFPADVTVIRNDVVLKSGDTVSRGDVLKITAAKDGKSPSSIKVNDKTFVNGSTFTADGTDVKIVTEYGTQTTGDKFPVTITVTEANSKDDDPVKGVTILIKDESNKTVATAETDKKGKIEVELPVGKYKYVVTEVPDGYLAASSSYAFTVNEGGKVRGKISIEIATSKVTLTVIDAKTKKGVPGVALVVKNSDKETVARVTTDDKGQAEITGLGEGTYTFEERYPGAGYSSNDESYKFTIDEDGKVKGTTEYSANPISIVFTVKDYSTGKGLSGATLVIKNNLGRTVATVTTDNNGEALIAGLAPGTYTLEQTGARKEYEASDDKITFNVLESGLVSGSTVVYNKEKATNSSASNNSNTNNSQSTTTNGSSTTGTTTSGSTTTSSSTTTSGTATGTTTSTTTTSTTITTNPNGGKTQTGLIKTGVETESKKSAVPVIASLAGIVAAIGAGVAFVLKKKKR